MTQLRPGARGIRLGLVAVALGGLAGCGSFLEPRVDPSRFYVLSTRSAPEVAMPAAARRRSYGIGPVTLPDYLKRPTVITRISESEIRPSHDDRWGEPIDKGVTRVLQEDLRQRLGTQRVSLYPWYASDRPDLQVVVDVQRLERDATGSAYLSAHWILRNPASDSNLRSGDTVARREPATPDFGGSVEAESDLLMQLAQEIAEGIASIGPPSRR